MCNWDYYIIIMPDRVLGEGHVHDHNCAWTGCAQSAHECCARMQPVVPSSCHES